MCLVASAWGVVRSNSSLLRTRDNMANAVDTLVGNGEIENALGGSFFKVLGESISNSAREVERAHQDRMLTLRRAYAKTDRQMTI